MPTANTPPVNNPAASSWKQSPNARTPMGKQQTLTNTPRNCTRCTLGPARAPLTTLLPKVRLYIRDVLAQGQEIAQGVGKEDSITALTKNHLKTHKPLRRRIQMINLRFCIMLVDSSPGRHLHLELDRVLDEALLAHGDQWNLNSRIFASRSIVGMIRDT